MISAGNQVKSSCVFLFYVLDCYQCISIIIIIDQRLFLTKKANFIISKELPRFGNISPGRGVLPCHDVALYLVTFSYKMTTIEAKDLPKIRLHGCGLIAECIG